MSDKHAILTQNVLLSRVTVALQYRRKLRDLKSTSAYLPKKEQKGDFWVGLGSAQKCIEQVCSRKVRDSALIVCLL